MSIGEYVVSVAGERDAVIENRRPAIRSRFDERSFAHIHHIFKMIERLRGHSGVSSGDEHPILPGND